MVELSIVTTDVVEEIVDDTGNIRSARTAKFHELDAAATQVIKSFLGDGDVIVRRTEKISEGHSFGGHAILHTVTDTAYVAGLAKLSHELLSGLKSWAVLNKGRGVKVSYEAKSGKLKELKITGFTAESTEQLFNIITSDQG